MIKKSDKIQKREIQQMRLNPNKMREKLLELEQVIFDLEYRLKNVESSAETFLQQSINEKKG